MTLLSNGNCTAWIGAWPWARIGHVDLYAVGQRGLLSDFSFGTLHRFASHFAAPYVPHGLVVNKRVIQRRRFDSGFGTLLSLHVIAQAVRPTRGDAVAAAVKEDYREQAENTTKS